MSYCKYYQANVTRSKCWFFVGVMRSFENVSFDRTLDKDESLIEFFVAPDREPEFLALMADLTQRGIIINLSSMPNRLEQELN